MNGILIINKPVAMTSHDVVAIVRKTLNIKKVGHTGTLDPDATGVLPICIGSATKLAEYITDSKKTYECTMKLGASTDTQDASGNVINTASYRHISSNDIHNAFNFFKGEILQVPPNYSAVSINGKRAYQLARGNKDFTLPPKKRFIYDISIKSIQLPEVVFEITCSKGTYIRIICNDVGEKLGTYAFMQDLKRISSGGFHISNAIDINEFRKNFSKDSIINCKAYFPLDTKIKISSFQTLVLEIDEVTKFKLKNGVKINLQKYTNLTTFENQMFFVVFDDNLFGIAVKNSNGIWMSKRLDK